jgi:isopentenyl diphosphate isomerase/L-lactate dehydrogenase-like FMN-dependent dehydrogenase
MGLVMNIMIMFYIIVWQILSTTSSCSMEEVAAAAPGVRFFQLYVSQQI